MPKIKLGEKKEKSRFTLFPGIASLSLGVIGAFLPLLPTTPFVLLAAFCFAKAILSGKPGCWLTQASDRLFMRGEKRAISIRGKRISVVMLLTSSVLSLIFVSSPWCYFPCRHLHAFGHMDTDAAICLNQGKACTS